MKTPSLAKLESAIFTFLQSRLSDRAKVSPTFPSAGVKSPMVTVSFVSDTYSLQSRVARSPSLQFVCYDTSYAKARQLQELVITHFDTFVIPSMAGQAITSYERVAVAGVDYDSASSLFFAMAEYRFYITLIEQEAA